MRATRNTAKTTIKTKQGTLWQQSKQKTIKQNDEKQKFKWEVSGTEMHFKDRLKSTHNDQNNH